MKTEANIVEEFGASEQSKGQFPTRVHFSVSIVQRQVDVILTFRNGEQISFSTVFSVRLRLKIYIASCFEGDFKTPLENRRQLFPRA